MDQPVPDYDLARALMVDGQVRPNRVSDKRILDAMRTIRRERFVPPHLAPFAYIDEDLPLGNGRVLMEPMVLARMIQLAHPMPGEHMLIVGAGTGYGAAVAAACGARVTALEEDPELIAIAREATARDVPPISFVTGPLAAGWPDAAPYDVILIEGAVPEIPGAIARQLKPEGRLVTVIAEPMGGGRLVLAEPSDGGVRAVAEYDAATPVLPSLRPAPAFSLDGI